MPAAEHVPAQITARIESKGLIGRLFDESRISNPFPVAFKGLQLPTADCDGELGFGVSWFQAHSALRIPQRGAAKTQLLFGCRGVAHEVTVLARNSNQKSDVLWFYLFRR